MRKLAVSLLLAAWLGAAALSTAQDEETRSSKHVWIDKYMDGPNLLASARQHIQKGDYRSAIEIYQGLIEKVRKEKGFASKVIASVESGKDVYLPVRRCCYEEILRLPPQGRELYSILYEAAAQRLYEQAVAAQDIEGLVALAQDYLLTSAGRKTCLRLADVSIEKAQHPIALHYLDTLASYHYRDSEEPALCALKRAACLMRSGQPAAARLLITSVKKRNLTRVESRICHLLLEAIKTTPPTTKDVFNSFYDGFVDLKNPPPVKLIEPVNDKTPDSFAWRFRFERQRAGPSRSSQSYHPNYNPLAVMGVLDYDLYPVYYNNLLFVHDSSNIFAFAIESGKLKWKEPGQEPGKLNGMPLGCFVSDGKLFVVLRNSNPLVSGPQEKVRALNELYCFNADRVAPRGENPPLWHTGTKRAPDHAAAPTIMGRQTSLLGQTSFTSIPFVEGSRVYVAGTEMTHKEQYYSVVCMRTDGKFLWQNRFCVTKWTNAYGRSAHILRASALRVTRGKVIVCTNVGVVAALCAFTGELEWIYKYPQRAAPDTRTSRLPGRDTITWEPTPPITWHGRQSANKKPLRCLVLAPGDSEFIFSLDMNALKLMWCEKRCGHRYVIGPRGDDIFVYGGYSKYPEPGKPAQLVVRQHRMPGGLVYWEAPLNEEELGKPAGKGVATPRVLYIPCANKLVEIVSGKERVYFGKASRAARWPEYRKSKSGTGPRPGGNGARMRTQVADTPPAPGGGVLDEKLPRGNVLVPPQGIVVGGYYWTNFFKRRERENDKK